MRTPAVLAIWGPRFWLLAALVAAALLTHFEPVFAESDGGAPEAGAPGGPAVDGSAGASGGGASGSSSAVSGSFAAYPTLWQHYEALFPRSGMIPTVTEMRGHEVLYQVPDPAAGRPRAVLFIAHGCSHAAHDWWPPSEACPFCLGLPEEMSQTQQALARRYAVLAMSSKNDRNDQCMDWTSNHKAAAQIITDFRRQYGFEDLPLYALGVSVGGGFVLKLPHYLKLDGVLSEVLGPLPDTFDPEKFTYKPPPTVFIAMERDLGMAARISADARKLRAMGVRTAQVRVPPRPVTPTFFSHRTAQISPELSVRIVAALQQIGMLDDNYMVTVDPRRTREPWGDQLAALVPELRGGMTADRSQVWEELNLAWSTHEIISDFTTAAFVWFESRGKGDFEEIFAEYAPPGCGVVGDAADILPADYTFDASGTAAALQQLRHQQEQQKETKQRPQEQRQEEQHQEQEQEQEQEKQEQDVKPNPYEAHDAALAAVAVSGQQADGAAQQAELQQDTLQQQAAVGQPAQEGQRQPQVQPVAPVLQPAGDSNAAVSVRQLHRGAVQPEALAVGQVADSQQQSAEQSVEQQLATGQQQQQQLQQATSLRAAGSQPVAVHQAAGEVPAEGEPAADLDAAEPSSTGNGSSATVALGATVGVALGATLLGALYRLSRRHAGFAALPTADQSMAKRLPAPILEPLPVSVPAKLAPIPESDAEV